MMMRSARLLALSGAATGLMAAPAMGQAASALLREGDVMPGAGGELVDSISGPASNYVGGYSFRANTRDGAGDLVFRVWGDATGGAGDVLRTNGTFGDFVQTGFEAFHGLSDAGEVSYSPSVTNMSTGDSGLDSIWLDSTPVLTEGDASPGFAGQFNSFNSRPGVTGDGKPYWIGGVTDERLGSTNFRVLYFGDDANVVLTSGDVISGLGTISQGSGVDFDFNFSRLGTNYLTPVDIEGSPADDGALVRNGAALSAGGSFVREATLVPVSVGGDGFEAWDNFDFMGINESGDTFFTGDTDGDSSSDEFIFLNDQFIAREGDAISTPNGPGVLDGSIESAAMNETADWAAVWDATVDGSNLETLIVNGQSILIEGQLVDWNGDGVVDASDKNARIDNFTGISSLAIGERDMGRGDGSFFDVYFTADVDMDGTVLEGAFRITIPAPGSAGLLAIAGLAAARRRRP